jgi:hypothetical protein
MKTIASLLITMVFVCKAIDTEKPNGQQMIIIPTSPTGGVIWVDPCDECDPTLYPYDLPQYYKPDSLN